MATLLGVNATLVAAGGVSTMLNGLINARVKCMLEKYTILGTEVSGSTITVGGIMPKGANVIAIIIYVSTAQTTVTLSIGDDETATRYASADTSVQAAGTYVFSGQNYVTDDTTPTSTDRQIVLTTGGATLTSGDMAVAVLYSID